MHRLSQSEMERDFLGMISKQWNNTCRTQQENFRDSADEEISLSLGMGFPPGSEKRRCANHGWDYAPPAKHPCLVLAPAPLPHHPSSAAGIRYDLNKESDDLRHISQLPNQQASSNILYYMNSSNVSKYALPDKANNISNMAANAFLRPSDQSTRGYTPTVAMARTASLSRFLKKRSHRLSQASTAHLIENTRCLYL